MKSRLRCKAGQWLWFDSIYRVNFVLVLGSDVEKRLQRVLPVDVAAEASGPDGQINDEGLKAKCGRCCLIADSPSGDVAVFWFAGHSDLAVIAHEALHAVYWILKRKGLRLDEPSEEAYTYYLEWLIRELVKRIFVAPRGETATDIELRPSGLFAWYCEMCDRWFKRQPEYLCPRCGYELRRMEGGYR